MENIKDKIFFDSKVCNNKYDIKNLIDESFSIIPLESNTDCLIATIDKIEILNNYIYILDKLSRAVYIFDTNGNYINKLFNIGQGPGEYVHLTDMTVTDSSVVVIDTHSLKQIEYELKTMKVLSEKLIFNKIWAMSIFRLSNSLYYLNDWSDSSLGKFRLFSSNIKSNEFDKFLNFQKKPISIGLGDYSQHYVISNNSALVIYNGCDFIYRIKEDSVYTEYEVIFKDNKVIYVDNIGTVLKNNNDGCILGISSINESEKHIFLNIDVIGEKEYTCLYDKVNGESEVYNRIAINSFLDNEQINVRKHLIIKSLIGEMPQTY